MAICIFFWRGGICDSSFKILLVRCFNLFRLFYTPSPLTPLSPTPPPQLIQINVYNRSVSPLPPALKINFGFKKLFFLSKRLEFVFKVPKYPNRTNFSDATHAVKQILIFKRSIALRLSISKKTVDMVREINQIFKYENPQCK